MTQSYDVVCLSHLRWSFVYQRPQHLLTRAARDRRVFFIEEPTFGDGDWAPLEADRSRLDVYPSSNGVTVVAPRLAESTSLTDADAALGTVVSEFVVEQEIDAYVLWYYTPMALDWTRHLEPLATVYDCMDELSKFVGAPVELGLREEELFERADLVFAGGESLYQAKRRRHPSVHLFPSSVDAAHFQQARAALREPADQAEIPHPRLGFFGVIDERMDFRLLSAVARARPSWQIVLVGPVVPKIDPQALSREPNVHYLGGKTYDELPAYLAGWDVALIPFALNEATRFISPTKTPEYLAAGKPVVSTPITDVVRPYGQRGFVRIAAVPEEFVAAVEAALEGLTGDLARLDAFLAKESWNTTWTRMAQTIEGCLGGESALRDVREGRDGGGALRLRQQAAQGR